MMPAQHAPARAAVDIDLLLQDTYLLVVELRNGAQVRNSPQLRALCTGQVEAARQALVHAGLDERSIHHVTHAQCALLDETVLGCVQGDAHAHWAQETLQAKFFNSHQAGEHLYEDMRAVLGEPAPNPLVLTAFQRVLMLGFLGRYRRVDDPQRQTLLTALNAQVAPFDISRPLVTQPAGAARRRAMRWLQAPALHILAAALLLASAWWWLDHLLGGAVASLLPVQV